MGYYAVK